MDCAVLLANLVTLYQSPAGPRNAETSDPTDSFRPDENKWWLLRNYWQGGRSQRTSTLSALGEIGQK
jgi:hypothetical protein